MESTARRISAENRLDAEKSESRLETHLNELDDARHAMEAEAAAAHGVASNLEHRTLVAAELATEVGNTDAEEEAADISAEGKAVSEAFQEAHSELTNKLIKYDTAKGSSIQVDASLGADFIPNKTEQAAKKAQDKAAAREAKQLGKDWDAANKENSRRDAETAAETKRLAKLRSELLRPTFVDRVSEMKGPDLTLTEQAARKAQNTEARKTAEAEEKREKQLEDEFAAISYKDYLNAEKRKTDLRNELSAPTFAERVSKIKGPELTFDQQAAKKKQDAEARKYAKDWDAKATAELKKGRAEAKQFAKDWDAANAENIKRDAAAAAEAKRKADLRNELLGPTVVERISEIKGPDLTLAEQAAKKAQDKEARKTAKAEEKREKQLEDEFAAISYKDYLNARQEKKDKEDSKRNLAEAKKIAAEEKALKEKIEKYKGQLISELKGEKLDKDTIAITSSLFDAIYNQNETADNIAATFNILAARGVNKTEILQPIYELMLEVAPNITPTQKMLEAKEAELASGLLEEAAEVNSIYRNRDHKEALKENKERSKESARLQRLDRENNEMLKRLKDERDAQHTRDWDEALKENAARDAKAEKAQQKEMTDVLGKMDVAYMKAAYAAEAKKYGEHRPGEKSDPHATDSEVVRAGQLAAAKVALESGKSFGDIFAAMEKYRPDSEASNERIMITPKNQAEAERRFAAEKAENEAKKAQEKPGFLKRVFGGLFGKK